jgi:hypothetical protein
MVPKARNMQDHINTELFTLNLFTTNGSAGITVGITTGYELNGRDSITGRNKKLFTAPQRSGQLWGPPSLLSSGSGGVSVAGGKPPGA